MKNKNYTKNKPNITNKNNMEPHNKTRGHLVIPYTEGLHESINNACNKYGIQILLKSSSTLKNMLITQKDKDNIRLVKLYTSTDAACWNAMNNTLGSGQNPCGKV